MEKDSRCSKARRAPVGARKLAKWILFDKLRNVVDGKELFLASVLEVCNHERRAEVATYEEFDFFHYGQLGSQTMSGNDEPITLTSFSSAVTNWQPSRLLKATYTAS